MTSQPQKVFFQPFETAMGTRTVSLVGWDQTDDGKGLYQGVISWEPLEDGKNADPVVSVSHHSLMTQDDPFVRLFDGLWDMGYRPKETPGDTKERNG